LVGEWKYNEAVVPLPNWKSIPVDMKWWNKWSFVINIWKLYWTDEETARKFANDIVWQFQRQFMFESY
jgi:hypothetical protein